MFKANNKDTWIYFTFFSIVATIYFEQVNANLIVFSSAVTKEWHAVKIKTFA